MLLFGKSFATTDFYPFVSPEKQQLFTQLTHELRCLVCQNENLAASQASLANELRMKIYTKVQAGETEQQIIDYMVQRYGEFVLYKPPLNRLTTVLWWGPFVLLLLAFSTLMLVIWVRKKRVHLGQLTADEQLKVEQILGAVEE